MCKYRARRLRRTRIDHSAERQLELVKHRLDLSLTLADEIRHLYGRDLPRSRAAAHVYRHIAAGYKLGAGLRLGGDNISRRHRGINFLNDSYFETELAQLAFCRAPVGDGIVGHCEHTRSETQRDIDRTRHFFVRAVARRLLHRRAPRNVLGIFFLEHECDVSRRKSLLGKCLIQLFGTQRAVKTRKIGDLYAFCFGGHSAHDLIKGVKQRNYADNEHGKRHAEDDGSH